MANEDAHLPSQALPHGQLPPGTSFFELSRLMVVGIDSEGADVAEWPVGARHECPMDDQSDGHGQFRVGVELDDAGRQ